MLTLIGDILNWIAAGIVFPLMFLPLAAALGGARAARGSAIFFALAAAVAAGGTIFATLAPDLAPAPLGRPQLYFAGALAALSALTFLAGGPARATALLAPSVRAIARAAGRIVMWLVLVMALTQFAVVILRYVFGLNFIFMQESITYMHGAVFLLAAGYALLTDDHVRVDIFYRGAAPRRQALVDFAGTYLLLFPTCLLILWTASSYVGNSWAVGEGSNEQSGVQALFLLKSCIPAFATLVAMAGFSIAARAGESLRRGA